MANPILVDDVPLLCPEAIERFNEILTKDSVVFEQGSGSSTAWIAKRGAFLISVEQSEEWFAAVSESLEGFGTGLPNPGPLPRNPLDLASEREYRGIVGFLEVFNLRLYLIPLGAGKDGHRDPFGKYLMSILHFPNDYFDIVYIDGWDFARLPCLGYAKSKIKPGGFAILDDTNWKWLRTQAYRLMEDWEIEEVTGLKLNPIPRLRTGDKKWLSCSTTFFRKPGG